MYGTIEQQQAASDPPAAGAQLNFLTETYTVNGVGVTAADVVSKPERVGVSGLEVLDNAADGMVEIIGDVLTMLLTMDWTVVVEYSDTGDESYETKILAMRDTDFTKVFQISRNVDTMEVYENFSTTRTVVDAGPYGNGIHKVAVTHAQFELSESADGNAVQTSTDEYNEALDLAAFGGFPLDAFSFNGCFIRTFEIIIPKVTAGELPGLSA